MPSSILTYSSTRPPLSTPGTTPAPSHHPTPCNSSPPPIPLPECGPDRCRSVDDGPGMEERQLRRAKAHNVAYHVHPPISLSNVFTTERYANPIQCPTTHVMKRRSLGRFLDIPMVVTERRRISRPRLPVDDDEESDGAQAHEEPLAGSRVRTGLVNVNTGTTSRRSAVVSGASRRSLIEDDEARRHSMLVVMRLFVCSFMLFFFAFLLKFDATLSNEIDVLTHFFSFLLFFTLRVAAILSFSIQTK